MEGPQEGDAQRPPATGFRRCRRSKRHRAAGAAAWPTDRAERTPCLRVFPPVSEIDAVRADRAVRRRLGHDFDFHLFDDRGERRDLASMPLDRRVLPCSIQDHRLDPDRGDEVMAIGAVGIVTGAVRRWQESFDSLQSRQLGGSPRRRRSQNQQR